MSRTESPELGPLGSLAVRFFSDPPAAPDNQKSSGRGASSDRSMLQGIAGGWGGENGANNGSNNNFYLPLVIGIIVGSGSIHISSPCLTEEDMENTADSLQRAKESSRSSRQVTCDTLMP